MSKFSIFYIISCVFLTTILAISDKPIVIIVSYDGFRFDYLDKTETPHFHSLKNNGVSLPFMRSSFTTKTFPNHHCIATGLWTESHGVVDNRVFDAVHNRNLSVDDQDFYGFHDEVIPIWLSNELANGTSGAVMWPGSLFSYGPDLTKISHVIPYNGNAPFTWRIDKGIEWLTDPVDPINLLLIYFEEPDSTGHSFGPESEQVKKMIRDQDDLTGYFINRLKQEGLFDRANLILLSDHGMQEVVRKRIIEIPQEIQNLFEFRTGGSPVWNIQPKNGQLEELYTMLKNHSESEGKYYAVYKKEEIPTFWHMANNRRVLPLMIVTEPGWVFNDMSMNETQPTAGVHGYTNRSPNMWPFFIAHGPAFRKGFEGEPIDNIDVFPMVSHLLGIPVLANNGSISNTRDLLLESTNGGSQNFKPFWTNYYILLLSLSILFIYHVTFKN